MKRNMKRNLLTLAAAGAIALGGFALVDAQTGTGGPAGHRGFRGHQFGMQQLTKSLNLTADQQTKIQPLFDQAKPQIIAIHKDAMQKTQAIMDKTMSQVRPMLTADQQTKFDAIQKAKQDLHNAMQELHSAMAQQ
jgi:Spy/CpxP family protein refolding chaperone